MAVGKAIYGRYKGTEEPVSGIIKERDGLPPPFALRTGPM